MNNNLEENSLLHVGHQIGFQVAVLEDIKERLPTLPKEDLVDGFISMKDTGKKIDKVIGLVRDEIMSARIDDFDEKDEKGNLYFSGNKHNLKLEYRVMKPVLDQEKAFEFFKEKGMLNKVVDVSVTLSNEQIEDLLYVTRSFSSTPNKLYSLLNIESTESVKEMKSVLSNLVKTIEKKSVVTVNVDKVNALVALEEISIEDIEHLFTTNTTYAFKEKKEKKSKKK